MPSALQIALARGLAVLTSAHGCGDMFRVRGASGTFSASLTMEWKDSPAIGSYVETSLLVLRSAFTALPAEGVVIDRADGSEAFRVAEVHPKAGGYINLIVRHEVR